MNPPPAEAAASKAALAGRVALLLVAFACAVAASFAAGTTSLTLVVTAVAMAGATAIRPLAIRLGRALKPATREPGRGTS